MPFHNLIHILRQNFTLEPQDSLCITVYYSRIGCRRRRTLYIVYYCFVRIMMAYFQAIPLLARPLQQN